MKIVDEIVTSGKDNIHKISIILSKEDLDNLEWSINHGYGGIVIKQSINHDPLEVITLEMER